MKRRLLALLLLAASGCGSSGGEQSAVKATRAELVGDKGLLKDIWSGAGSSNPSLFAELLGKAYFVADDDFFGRGRH